jgi:hypothetical protein
MGEALNHGSLHRTAKYFMDSGRAATHDAAMDLLQQFGLTIHVGAEITHSLCHQIALLTLINVARRTFLGGIEVVGLHDGMSLTALAPMRTLTDAVHDLGGRITSCPRPNWPSAMIGAVDTTPLVDAPCWRVTWEGWRGGVVPIREGRHLADGDAMALAPALAAAVCAGEAFAHHAGDHPMAGRRAAGLSLWHPGADWLAADPAERALTFLPSRLWLIGLGNLGQAFAWLLACLPYGDRSQIKLLLQDFDRIAPSNESTSLLSSKANVGQRKSRMVSDWLEARGFDTMLEERRFGNWTQRAPDEPGVALCGVDNAYARTALERVGFDLVIEAGLGAGPHAFRSISMHSFPASRSAEQIWSQQVGQSDDNLENMPAYQALKHEGMDSCGLTQLASRTVGVPFVGLIAGTLVIAELLRRLHGGNGLELASGSVAALEDFETAVLPARHYGSGHVPCGSTPK